MGLHPGNPECQVRELGLLLRGWGGKGLEGLGLVGGGGYRFVFQKEKLAAVG